ncbi:GD24894 [Drosophila simulans]|uniref:GD24894 n=1 Tax=Drosophila simulans TaxID=7240 RepID=B4QD67_DROSI|nr:GD24894 [Drosophila simulans]
MVRQLILVLSLILFCGSSHAVVSELARQSESAIQGLADIKMAPLRYLDVLFGGNPGGLRGLDGGNSASLSTAATLQAAKVASILARANILAGGDVSSSGYSKISAGVLMGLIGHHGHQLILHQVDFSLVDLPLVDLPLVDLSLVDLLLVNLPLVDLPLVDLSLVDLPLLDLSLVDLPLVDLPLVVLPLVDIPLVDLPLMHLSMVDLHLHQADHVDHGYFHGYTYLGLTFQEDLSLAKTVRKVQVVC